MYPNIELKKNSLDEKEYCVERINYIIKTLMDKDDITKFLIRFFKYRKSLWDNYNELEKCTNDFIDYIINKITISISL